MANKTTSKNALIVYAHQEPKSFNAALRDTAVDTLRLCGYIVEVSDLYAQGFDPRATKDDFTGTLLDPDHMRYNLEAKHAYETSTMCAQIQAEVDKLKRADVIVFQFPIHWMSVPAILKGWFDKVLVPGFAFEFPNKLYDNGHMKGKKAILSLTTGGFGTMYTDRGVGGDINVALWPIHYGTLRLCGFDVMRPHICFCPGYASDEQLKENLVEFAKRLKELHNETPQKFVSLSNFDFNKGFTMTDEYLKEESNNIKAPSFGHLLDKKIL